MSRLRTGIKALGAAGFLTMSTFAVPVQATEAIPTQAEEKAIATEKTARGSLASAVFTTAVVDGNATDYRSEINSSVSKVFFVTVLDSLAGQTVTHRWKYKGKVMATAKFDVKRDREKVWSSNAMKPEWTGEWRVEVVNGSGQIVDSRSFSFLAPL
jgi:hypothetical protein